MCSVEEDDDIENFSCSNNCISKPKLNQKSSFEKCNKCRTSKPCIVLRNKDAYCKDCFLSGTVHKFKSFLGKHRLVKPNDGVLISFKDGHPSTALLHLIRSGLNLNTPKKLQFKPFVIYIIGNSFTDSNILKKVYDTVTEFDFILYFTSLKNYITNPENLESLLHRHVEDLEHTNFTQDFDSLFGEKCNETTKESLLNIYEHRLLIDVAKHLNCTSVFVPDIAIDVAEDLLTNVALGRGIHLPLDTGICDTRDPLVKIVRPLRHFEMKELALYNVFNKVEPLILLTIKETSKRSVQDLMKNFIADLQTNSPSTVGTVIRTGDKLELNKNILESKVCKLCRAPLEITRIEMSAAEATNFSRWVSREMSDIDTSKEDPKILERFKNQQSSSYCYACNKIAEYIIDELITE